MTESEEILDYGYEFLFQLGDYLQDIKGDMSNNHITLMLQLAEKYYLDSIIIKLLNYKSG